MMKALLEVKESVNTFNTSAMDMKNVLISSNTLCVLDAEEIKYNLDLLENLAMTAEIMLKQILEQAEEEQRDTIKRIYMIALDTSRIIFEAKKIFETTEWEV